MKILSKGNARASFNAMAQGLWSVVPADYPVTHVLDLGANVGYFSTFARMRWPKARVLAVEPDATSFSCLQENVAGLRIDVIRAAFGPHGTVSLVSPKHDFSAREYLPTATTDATTVPSHDLHWFWRLMHVTPSSAVLLKMDIEGAEHQLMDRPELGLDALRSCAAIAMEIHGQRDKFPGWFARSLADTHKVRTVSWRRGRWINAMHAVRKDWL